MPIFEYKCKKCGKQFEEFVFTAKESDSDIECPSCGTNNPKRLISAPSINCGDSPNDGCCPPPSGGFS